MSSRAIDREFNAITSRTRRLVGGSTIVHLILLLLLVYHETTATTDMGLTEIEWVELAAPAPPEEASPPVARKETEAAPIQKVARKPARNQTTEQFKRELVRAKVEPKPQTAKASEDVLSRRLETVQASTGAFQTQITSLVQPPKIGAPTPAGVPDTPKTASRTDLTRDEKKSSSPAQLQRIDAPKPRKSVMATVPTIDTPSRASVDVALSDAVRHLAGAKLIGEVADRELVSYEKPVYPEWAKQDGVEGSVTLRFYVLADGSVKDNIFIEKTSGFGDFDDNAVEALRTWRFEPLRASAEQWGVITFNYRLSDSR